LDEPLAPSAGVIEAVEMESGIREAETRPTRGSALGLSVEDRLALLLYGKKLGPEEVREIIEIEMLRRKLEGGSS
jgi:hypothetical protein